MIGRLVEVTWHDTVSSTGWRSPDDAARWFASDGGEYKSVGYLFEMTKDYVALVRSYHNVEEGNVCDLIQFPRQVLINVRYVKTGRKVLLP